MFNNLINELKKREISLEDYSNLLGKTSRAIRYKLEGRTEFTLEEIEKTAEIIDGSTWEELFKR